MEALPWAEFGTSGLVAAALIFVVIKMLKNGSENMALERTAHREELNLTLEAHKAAITTITQGLKDNTDRIVEAQRDSTKDLTAEIRLLRGELVAEEP